MLHFRNAAFVAGLLLFTTQFSFRLKLISIFFSAQTCSNLICEVELCGLTRAAELGLVRRRASQTASDR